MKSLIPVKYRKILSQIKNTLTDGYAVKTYSQEGEDVVLRRLFEWQSNGFYVDIGAHHPMEFSNSYFFYKKGWRGINIDPLPGIMRFFKIVRPKDINLEIAISDKKETLTYYAFETPSLNGFSQEISERRSEQAGCKILFKKDIETQPLSEVLDRYLPEGQEIDFMSIDVEGLDFRVLQSNNWEKYSPKVILVESLTFDLENFGQNEIYNFLKPKGYRLFAKLYLNLIFKRDDFSGPPMC